VTEDGFLTTLHRLGGQIAPLHRVEKIPICNLQNENQFYHKYHAIYVGLF